MYPELDLLTIDQFGGEDYPNYPKMLNVFKKYGYNMYTTDYSMALGEPTNGHSISGKGSDRLLLKQTKQPNKQIQYIEYYDSKSENPHYYPYSLHPIIQSSDILKQLYPYITTGEKGAPEVEYGEYPQFAVSKKMQKELTKALSTGKGIHKTGRQYTYNSVNRGDYYSQLSPKSHIEYEYKGKKYVCVRVNYDEGKKKYAMFSNLESYAGGDYIWIEVSPVKWIVDLDTKTLISKYGLIYGIRFAPYKANGLVKWEDSEAYNFLNTYMAQDLFQPQPIMKYNTDTKNKKFSFLGKTSKTKVDTKLIKQIKLELKYAASQISELPNSLIRTNLEEQLKWFYDYTTNNIQIFNNEPYNTEYKRFLEKLDEFIIEIKKSLMAVRNNTEERDLHM